MTNQCDAVHSLNIIFISFQDNQTGFYDAEQLDMSYHGDVLFLFLLRVVIFKLRAEYWMSTMTSGGQHFFSAT